MGIGTPKRHMGIAHGARCALAATLAGLAALALPGSAQVRAAKPAPKPPAPPRTASALYQTTRVWTVELTVTPENLAAMEPQMPAGAPFGAPGPGGPVPGGPMPGGPVPGGPMPGGKGGGPRASMLLAPLLMMHGDTDRNGRLSDSELKGLAGRWWEAWDRRKRGAITMGELTTGLKAAFAQPAREGAGVGAPDPGGPMGPSPGGPGMGAPPRRVFDFPYVRAALRFEGLKIADVGLRYKGNNTFMESAGSLKRPLKIDLSRFSKGRKLAGVSTLNLHNNVTDPSYMNEAVAYHAFRQAGVPAPRTAYARVYLTVPGTMSRQYLGLYTLVENIDEDFAQSNFGTREGAILKPVTPFLFGFMGDDWKPYKEVYDPKTPLTAAQKGRLLELCRLVTQADAETFASGIARYIDIDELAAYLAAAVWIGDQDSLLDMGQNLYLHLDPKTERMQFIPWDQDHSFGNWFLAGSQQDREQLSIAHPWIGPKPFLERIFGLPEFRSRYMANLRKLTDGPFTPERFAAQVDKIATAIRPAVRQESAARLARLEQAVAGRRIDRMAIRGQESGMTAPPMPADGPAAAFMQGARWMKPIKPFVQARSASVKAQLAGSSPGVTIASIGPPMMEPGPGDFGPWSILAPVLMQTLDRDGGGRIAREDFVAAFEGWTDDSGGELTPDELQAIIDEVFPMPPPMFPEGGPPPGLP